MRRSAGDLAENANVIFDVGKRAGIRGQEAQRVFQKFRESLLLVRDRADDQRRFQVQDFVCRIHVPAVAEPWQAVYGRYIRAPFRHADKMFLRAYGTKNGCRTWRKRNDAKLDPTNRLFHLTDRIAKRESYRYG